MSVPTINVNMRRCTYATGGESAEFNFSSYCNTDPINVPCPIPPTVEMTVRPGECSLEGCYAVNPDGTPYSPETGGHGPGCPARPIGVTCTIAGDGTWAGSEVTEIEGVPVARPPKGVPVEQACRASWWIVRVLMLGHTDLSALITGPIAASLLAERDAVFRCLAAMARAEDALHNAAGVSATALRECGARIPERRNPYLAMAEADLAAYVARLLEQVKDLGHE